MDLIRLASVEKSVRSLKIFLIIAEFMPLIWNFKEGTVSSVCMIARQSLGETIPLEILPHSLDRSFTDLNVSETDSLATLSLKRSSTPSWR